LSDLSGTIIPKSDQLNADDLITGPRTIKVTKVALLSEEQPVAIHFEGDGGKPYKPGKSMRRVLVHCWGSDGNVYIGRSMTIFRDEKIQFGGMAVGGIRISHLSHIDRPVTMALTETKARRKPFTVQPLQVAPSTEDKVEAGAKALLERIRGAADMAALEAITADAAVVKQRDWLTKNRPALAESIGAAVAEKLAGFDPPEEAGTTSASPPAPVADQTDLGLPA
jgi:hypothetical protein